MENKNLYMVDVNIADSFVCSFEAELNQSDKGKLLTEINFEKNFRELCHIALIKDFNTIMLQYAPFGIIMKIEEGNLDEFIGEYKVTYLGFSGGVSINMK